METRLALEDKVRQAEIRAEELQRRVTGPNNSSQWAAAQAYVEMYAARRALREHLERETER